MNFSNINKDCLSSGCSGIKTSRYTCPDKYLRTDNNLSEFITKELIKEVLDNIGITKIVEDIYSAQQNLSNNDTQLNEKIVLMQQQSSSNYYDLSNKIENNEYQDNLLRTLVETMREDLEGVTSELEDKIDNLKDNIENILISNGITWVEVI